MTASSGNRSMRVDPQRVVELAARSDEAVQRLAAEWTEVSDELATACDTLGDCAGASSVAMAYVDSHAAADEVVWALARALEGGVAALVDAARDVAEADETAAFEIGRAVGGSALLLGDAAGRRGGRGA